MEDNSVESKFKDLNKYIPIAKISTIIVTVILIVVAIAFFIIYSIFPSMWNKWLQKGYEIAFLVGKFLYLIILGVYTFSAYKYTRRIIEINNGNNSPETTTRIDPSQIPTHLVLILTLFYLLPGILHILVLVFFVAILKGISKINQSQNDDNWWIFISKLPIFFVILMLITTVFKYFKYKIRSNDSDDSDDEKSIKSKLVGSIIIIILLILYIFISSLFESVTDNTIVQPIKITGNTAVSLFSNSGGDSGGNDCYENNIVLFVICIIWLIGFFFAYIGFFVISCGYLKLNPMLEKIHESITQIIVCKSSKISEALMHGAGEEIETSHPHNKCNPPI